MKPKAVSESLSFRYLPGFLPLVISLGLFCLYALFYGNWIEVKNYGYERLLSLKGIFLLLLFLFGNLVLWSLTVRLWQIHWHFTFTPTHFIAVHRLRRQRVEVPWESIVRVRRLPRAWWARGGGGLGISQIQTAEGYEIPFMTHLMLRYKKFLEELKARAVRCRSFDPYFDEWER